MSYSSSRSSSRDGPLSPREGHVEEESVRNVFRQGPRRGAKGDEADGASGLPGAHGQREHDDEERM